MAENIDVLFLPEAALLPLSDLEKIAEISDEYIQLVIEEWESSFSGEEFQNILRAEDG